MELENEKAEGCRLIKLPWYKKRFWFKSRVLRTDIINGEEYCLCEQYTPWYFKPLDWIYNTIFGSTMITIPTQADGIAREVKLD